jgi:hypothetical protein
MPALEQIPKMDLARASESAMVTAASITVII